MATSSNNGLSFPHGAKGVGFYAPSRHNGFEITGFLSKTIDLAWMIDFMIPRF